MSYSRRHFLAGLGAAAATASVPVAAAHALSGPALLYPPSDLSYFDTPLHHGPMKIQIGYAAITWDEKDNQAIEDIAAVGYPGIQLRPNVLGEYPDPHALLGTLAKHNLTFVALSSGDAPLDPALERKMLATHTAHARYLHEAGGKYLQVIGTFEKKKFIASDYKREGALLTEIGKRAADYGIKTGFHNHMGSIGQTPEQVDAILEAADPRYVKLELDTGHYVQGGGDPAAAIRKYGNRLLFLHLKDVESAATKSGYQFVELGEGRVNFPAIFDALRSTHFRGWGVVELDGERAGARRTPKQSAELSKEYLIHKLGVQV
ncbi:MAG: sugar phosphate isomerase/epimerase family protein [Acidobacteriaceae bacterium]